MMTAMTRRWGWALALPLVLILMVVGFSPANGAYALAPTSGLKYYDKTNASVTVTWKRQSGINRYAIQYSRSSSFSNPKYSVPTSVKTQADAFRQIGDLQPSTKYYFRIRATYSNGSNASDWSSSINITTSTYAFSAPSKPAISNVLSDKLDLSWSEVPNAGKYRVRYSTSSTFAADVITAEPIDNKTSISGLTPNTNYYFQVRGLESKVDDNGDPYLLTSYSSTASTSTNTFTAAPPEGLALEASSKGKIVLQWKQVPEANGYRIQGALDTTKRYLDSDRIPASAPSGTAFSTSNGIVTATMTGYCDSGVAPAVGACNDFQAGKTYIFRVTAMNNGERISDYTNAAGLKVVASGYPLSTPSDFKVVTSTEKSVTLSWTAVQGATSYRLQQSKSSTMGSARYLYDLCGPAVTCTSDGDTRTVTLTNFESNSAAVSEPIKANTSYYYKMVSQVNSPALGVAPDSYPQFEDRASDYTTTAVKATTAKYPFKAPALSKVDAGTTSSSIKLSWDSLAGQPYFAIDRSKDTAFAKIDTTTCVPANGVGPHESNQTGLSGETTYYFRMRVASSSGCATARSDNSSPLSARTSASVGKIVGDVDGPAGVVGSMVATAYAGAGPCSDGLADVAGTDRLDSSGGYEITGLRAGTTTSPKYYCVLLSQVDDNSTYTSPWVINGVTGVPFDEKQKFMHFATAYKLVATTAEPKPTMMAQPTTVVPGKTVTGTVKFGSTPLANARITVTAAPADPDDLTREVRTVVTTNESGQFTIRGLMGGKYKFVPTKDGYKGVGGYNDTASYWYDNINNAGNSYALSMAPN